MKLTQAKCPPESGGQRHRVLRDDARGGSLNEMSRNAFLESAAPEPPPPHDLDCCLDRAALLTQEGISLVSIPPESRNVSITDHAWVPVI